MRKSLLMLILGVTCVLGQERFIPWDKEDIVNARTVSSAELSPSGDKLAYLSLVLDGERDRFATKLHVIDLEQGKARQVVFGPEQESTPRWSPDGRRLAYLTTRVFEGEAKKDDKPESQVWLLDLSGGEPRPVSEVSGGVRGFQWIDSQTLLISARETKTLREIEEKKSKDASVVVEDTLVFREAAFRLFRLEIAEGVKPKKPVRVTTNPDAITTFLCSPDGAWVVYVRDVSPIDTDNKEPPRVFLRSLTSGTERELFLERRNRPTVFDWSPDSRGFYAQVPTSTVDGETSAAVTLLSWVDAQSGAIRSLPLDWERGLARGGLVALEDGFLALLRNGVHHVARRYTRGESGLSWGALDGRHAARLFGLLSTPKAEAVVYVTGTSSAPDVWYRARLSGAKLSEEAVLLKPREDLEKKPMARAEIVRWNGAADEEVEGILYEPLGYVEGEKYPLIVMPHGGPHGADLDRFRDRWAYPVHLYAQRGAFCLFVNYHGSEGYGLAFGESIRHRYYELEIKDILAGVDKLVKDGRVDPDRLGLLGWSNGAILAIATLTFADRYAPDYSYTFKACAPGAGDVNWTSDYGNCEFGVSFDDFYLGGAPWKLSQLYLEKSPLFYAEKVTTPTIVFFGDKDTAVPTEQGWQWYRALQQIGKAPVRFVLFPGQGHGLTKPSFQRRKISEELLWFDRYLFERPKSPLSDRVLPVESPLARALASKRFLRRGEVLGLDHAGHVIPETVVLGDLEVGRFEVTRAQWASLFPEVASSAGENDYPMAGITAEDAERYVEELSKVSGRSYRLPTEEEFGRLPKGSAENTLDYWAGYELSPESAADVRSLVGGLARQSSLPPLLLSVGSRPPGVRGFLPERVELYDVGGNVGEWVRSADGSHALIGGCAFLVKEAGEAKPVIPVAYGGLRVVLDVKK